MSNCSQESNDIKVTVLLPCLNEERTIPECIKLIRKGFHQRSEKYEILVVDNGSIDKTAAIAEALGARVVKIEEKGYGNALIGGIHAAEGEWIIMGDADGSYDFSEIGRFIEGLRQGYELVMGCRLPSGGGKISPGAMPWKHRWIGNPVLTAIGKILFKSKINDFHCGLRGFSRKSIIGLNLVSTGMEFASEMIIASSISRLKITEVPITLYPDLRNRPPHLRSWRDGWRHLRLMLLYSPMWLFLIPSLSIGLLGLISAITLGMGSVHNSRPSFDTNALLFSCLLLPLSQQLIFFGLFATTYARIQGFLAPSPYLKLFYKHYTLEKGIGAGIALVFIGLIVIMHVLIKWRGISFDEFTEKEIMLRTIPAAISVLMGIQVIFGSFVISILSITKSKKS